MAKVLNFEVPENETVNVNIGGVSYTLPADLDVGETATMLKMFSASKEIESDDPDPEAYDKLADGLMMIRKLFEIHNNKRALKKLRLTQELAVAIFTQVYQGNA